MGRARENLATANAAAVDAAAGEGACPWPVWSDQEGDGTGAPRSAATAR